MAAISFEVHMEGLDAVSGKIKLACYEAEHLVAWQIRKDTEPFVPMLNGSLRIRTRVEGNQVIYPGPYARFLYGGKLMVDPETGSAWAKLGAAKEVTEVPLQLAHGGVDPQATDHWFEASKAQNLEKWIRVADKAVKHEFK